MMDWEKLTADVVAATTAAFGSLMSEKSDEHFYAFALYTDEYAETISPSANSIERFEAILRDRGGQYPAVYKWGTAEWAYEAWHSELFTGIYRDLEKHRKTLPESEEGFASYKTSVHECMISALKRMDENGFFAKGREDITLFISSSDDDDAFDMENQSAKRLNPERVYMPFLKRYGDDGADES
jgi:Domain of unknown function (DUF4303)